MRYFMIAVLVGGCGLDLFGEAGGGKDNLPNAGAGPWARFASDDTTPADEPFVLFDRDAELFDPAVLGGGAGLRVWMTREAAGMPDQIYYAEVADPHSLPAVAPRLALAADQGWEQGRVAAPSVFRDGATLTMFYEAGTTNPAIGIARSTDDGATWTNKTMAIADARAPTAARIGDQYVVFVTRPGLPGIWRATSPTAAPSFTFDPTPTIEARPTVDKAFDAADVGDPDLVAEDEGTGTAHYGLYYVGYASAPSDAGTGNPAVGYFGSFDGATWQRFGTEKPQLAAPATGPAVLHTPGHGTMLYVETKRGLRAIAAAHCP